MSGIKFYCGLNEKDWNHHPVQPGRYTCIAPRYGRTARTKYVTRVVVPETVQEVLVDSAAFSDRWEDRLSFEGALQRQIEHAERFNYTHKVAHVASYDLLIDEKWKDGERSKLRWTTEEAEEAVKVTVAAARYISEKRGMLRGIFGRSVGLCLSAQGVEVEQYLRCAEQIVPLMEDGDIFGLGGWCITGLFKAQILPSFREIMGALAPFLSSRGVRRVHVWGVIFPEALALLLALCDTYGLECSTDSSGPCRYPVMGQWGYGSWRIKNRGYPAPPILDSCRARDEHGEKAPTCTPGTQCRGLERAKHVRLTGDWLEHFSEREPVLYQRNLRLIKLDEAAD